MGLVGWNYAYVAKWFRSVPHDQEALLPADMRSWLPPGHLTWQVLGAVRELDLSGFTAAYRADGQGQAPYDPAMMLALVLYCTRRRTRSPPGGRRPLRGARMPGSPPPRTRSPTPRGGWPPPRTPTLWWTATPAGKKLYKRRVGLVEPAFAQLFARFGRYVSYRGHDAVDAEVKLLGAVHNLAKLFEHRRRHPAAAARPRRHGFQAQLTRIQAIPRSQSATRPVSPAHAGTPEPPKPDIVPHAKQSRYSLSCVVVVAPCTHPWCTPPPH
jgi:hypothetical protein